MAAVRSEGAVDSILVVVVVGELEACNECVQGKMEG